ncbi:PREDICTED: G-protein coupled receptor moody-like [Priapulus caudatus]|uniref:G-protein coupled receptor moody-like n=1 Tax=Priapulus caudatus TaxID=37621 RepID=A0ABM1F0V0_PRICU|nr:PREDICTED: G-protein coupled receptor moody-like [Priapulus caudatus]
MNATLREPVIVFACAWSVTVAVAGVLGNGVAILALARSSTLLKNSTTVFVLALCVCGLLICAANIPLQVALFFGRALVYPESLCVAVAYTYYVNTGAALMCLMAVAANRYVLILAPTLFGAWGRFGFSPSLLLCTIVPTSPGGPSALTVLPFVGFGLPFVAIVVCYGRIFCAVRSSRRAVHEQVMASASAERRARRRACDERRLTAMILVIACVHTTLYLPYAVVNAFVDVADNADMHLIVEVAVWVTHCVNPLLYALVNERYRHAYRALLPCCRSPDVAAAAAREGAPQTLPDSTVNASQRGKAVDTRAALREGGGERKPEEGDGEGGGGETGAPGEGGAQRKASGKNVVFALSPVTSWVK